MMLIKSDCEFKNSLNEGKKKAVAATVKPVPQMLTKRNRKQMGIMIRFFC